MKIRITKYYVRFDEDGVAEVELPDVSDDVVHSHLKYERLNDQALELFMTEIFWTEEDDEEFVLGALDIIEEDE